MIRSRISARVPTCLLLAPACTACASASSKPGPLRRNLSGFWSRRIDDEHLTRGFEVPAARHVEAIPGRVGAVLVELPLRDAGCLLPTWDDLVALSGACRARGVALHFDGARIWESQPWFDHSAEGQRCA